MTLAGLSDAGSLMGRAVHIGCRNNCGGAAFAAFVMLSIIARAR